MNTLDELEKELLLARLEKAEAERDLARGALANRRKAADKARKALEMVLRIYSQAMSEEDEKEVREARKSI